MAFIPLDISRREASPTPDNTNDLTMLVSGLLRPRMAAMGMPEPFPVFLFGVIFSALAGALCVAFIAHRALSVRNWQRLAYMQWFVLLQFSVAACFMIVSAVLRYAYDSNEDVEICRKATKACIVMYTIIKLFYLLLADRLHVVRTAGDRRVKSKLYIFHYTFIIATIVVWNVVLYVKGWITLQDGTCVVGAIRDLFVIVIVMDTVLNLYLTIFFLYYLSKSFRISSASSGRKFLSSFSRARRGPPARQLSAQLRTLTIRTVVGLVITLTATMINAVSMIVMNGEAMWFCWIACKGDIIVNVIVLFWITSPGAEREASGSGSGGSGSGSGSSGSRKESDVTATTITLAEFSPELAPYLVGDNPDAEADQKQPAQAHVASVRGSDDDDDDGDDGPGGETSASSSPPLKGRSSRPAAGSRTQSFAEFLRAGDR
ncbi:hypothetical protein Micbo1qcDRAFT_200585 [Microdochium bolleyi]|uniref:Uncharacterized protein n=1 Tax=Microdochium bolleyi TaxID=196109 RepID=A0A136JDD6_9PEZI|nr:hypothetical protein Micbo1qcDRAFT_200585 [Microdochium bolleyi]